MEKAEIRDVMPYDFAHSVKRKIIKLRDTFGVATKHGTSYFPDNVDNLKVYQEWKDDNDEDVLLVINCVNGKHNRSVMIISKTQILMDYWLLVKNMSDDK